MKLCQINVTINSGSTGRIAEEIGQSVINAGWESYIAYGRKSRISTSQLIRIGDEWSIRYHALSTRLFDNHGFASVKATNQFIKDIDRIHPDIIHLHNIHGYYLNVEILFNYLKKKAIPVVWTLHDCWPLTGHCSYFDYVNCNKWQTECDLCPNLKGYPSTLFRDHSKSNFLKKKQIFTSVANITFVAPSYWMKNVLSHSFFKSYPVQVIHNGINIDVFKPIDNKSLIFKYGLDFNKKIILGVASIWDRRKGLDDFIQLSKKLSVNEQIVLVGLSNKQITGLPEGIIGINRTENVDELAALYSVADVFVNPTWVDNFPTTNIEALACGTPVVTYQTGGSSEAVSKDTGLVVEKGNISMLYSSIFEILKKGKGYYSAFCRQRAETLFDRRERNLDYIELYKSLV